jgi:hypothetical protein
MRKKTYVCLTGGKNNAEGTVRYVLTPEPSTAASALRLGMSFSKTSVVIFWKKTGVYILENTPPPPPGDISRYHLGGKYIKRGREKGGKCQRKRKKGERK